MNNKVNVIIPIYNSYEFVIKCIDSVLRNTPKDEYNLILINDNSLDIRISNYLKDLEDKQVDNIFIHHNIENLGFIESVNIGMMYDTNSKSFFKTIFNKILEKNNETSNSYNDVILLNSDTEVTKNWLNKIKKAAYSKENIATVTPLTNHGTICAIPKNLEHNELPEKLSLDEYSEIIEKTSLRLYIQIPTAVGFCMYIKRTVINKIGLFDAKTYGKGYGEENDFCCRARNEGYIHILCDDTFVYHKGSVSFGDEQFEYRKKNRQILDEKYPYYTGMIRKYIRENSIKPIIDNVKLQLKIRNNNNKNVLFISHNNILKGNGHGSIGGSQRNTRDLIDNIKTINSYCLYVEGTNMFVQAYIDDEIIEFKFELDKKLTALDFTNSKYKDNLEKIIKYFNIECIHVKHLINNTFDIIDIAKKYEVPIYLTLHEYYLICPKHSLLNYDNKYCEKTRSIFECNYCLNKEYNYPDDTITLWNKNAYNYLKKFDKIFAPSNTVKNIYTNYYKSLYGEFDISIEILEHGVPQFYINNNKPDDDTFRVAFIGGLCLAKGSELIRNIMLESKNPKIEWHTFGNIGDESLSSLRNKYFINHGRYERDQIQNLLISNKINLVCILSVCPETYCHTLSETITAKIPVLVTEIGALKERVEIYDCGWSVPVDSSANHVLNMIDTIISSKESYRLKTNNLSKLKTFFKEDSYRIYEQYYLETPNKILILDKELNKYMLKKLDRIYNEENQLATIMMLSYNNLEYMKDAINSVLSQDYKYIELIINDDASNDFDDKFIDEIKSFIETNKKSNLIRYSIEQNETNIGVIKSYNKVINLAHGKYLIPLCCDDEFFNSYTVKSIVNHFKTSNDLIVTGFCGWYDKNLIDLKRLTPSKSDVEFFYQKKDELYKRLCKGNFIAGACTSYTKEFIEKYGLFDEDYILIEDWGRLLNITRKGCTVGFINKILIKYREGGVTTLKQYTSKEEQLIKEKLIHDHIVVRNKEITPYN